MNKIILLFSLSFCMAPSYAQPPGERILFVIDSIPILTDPESWNQVAQEDISDISIIRNKDSLKLLGWEQLDGITYIFTKGYRNRPDSIKRIPGLKQMMMKNDAWYLHDILYSGKYIDYYNNGRIQNEGILVNGKLNGELTVYFKNGNKKSVTGYKDGVLNGTWNDYYKNGVLMQTKEYREGKMKDIKMYFINGQSYGELRPKKQTLYDTSVSYYSTGQVKEMKFSKTGKFIRTKKDEDMAYYATMFFQNLITGNLKEANKLFYRLWLIDSTSTDIHFKEGILLARESRFDQAIAEFDKALAMEPLMRESLTHRGITRIKKYKLLKLKIYPKDNKDIPLTVEDMVSIPDTELAKICADLLLADDIDPSDLYVKKEVTEAIINFCRKNCRQ
jgi:tetratricopeptide (TPR) repeat protein